MRITLINQFFHPDLSATAQIATELAVDLARQGHHVRALCARGSYLGKERLPPRSWHEGVEIHRVFSTARGKGRAADRIFDYGSFLTSLLAEVARTSSDVFLCMSTPPMLVSAVANVLRFKRGAKLVYWAQDIYPELAGALGAIPPDGFVHRSLSRLQSAMLRRCDLIVTLGQAMRERLGEDVRGRVPVIVIPNWADGADIRPLEAGVSPLRSHFAPDVKTLVMYSGNMGRGHDIETMLEAARLLSSRRDLAFAFVGAGAKSSLVEKAARQLPNLQKLPYQSKDDLATSLAAGDLHLASLLPEALGLMEPSKVYGIMAAGRPCVFVGPEGAEVAKSLVACEGGVVCRPADPPALAKTLAQLADDPARCARMGRSARQAFLTLYDRPLATKAFDEALGTLKP